MRAALFGLAMLGLAFASVPLYRIFCQVTGFDGTTQRAEAAPGEAGEMGVRFDANIDARAAVEVRARAAKRASSRASARPILPPNHTARPATGQRGVQRLARAGRAIFQQDRMLLLHRADAQRPARRSDAGGVLRRSEAPHRPATNDIHEITLSYTFYPVENSAEAR